MLTAQSGPIAVESLWALSSVMSRAGILSALPMFILRAHSLRLSRHRIGLSIVYHKVAEQSGDPARDLVPALDIRTFERQMLLAKNAFAPVKGSAFVGEVRNRQRGQRIPLAITFDDDLSSHARIVLPVLVRLGVTATFFLSGGSGGTDGYWWEHLQVVVDNGLAGEVLRGPDVPPSVAAEWSGRASDIHLVARALLSMPPEVRDAVSDRLKAAAVKAGVLPQADRLSVPEIRALVDAGLEVGFHTVRHDYLPGLDAPSLFEALSSGREELSRITRQPVRVLAYPHGGVDESVAAAARQAGFLAAFTTRSGVVEADQDEMMLGRIECGYNSAAELAHLLSSPLRSHLRACVMLGTNKISSAAGR